jgi:hypothetical protein
MSNSEELQIANHNCVCIIFCGALVDCLHADRNEIVESHPGTASLQSVMAEQCTALDLLM